MLILDQINFATVLGYERRRCDRDQVVRKKPDDLVIAIKIMAVKKVLSDKLKHP